MTNAISLPFSRPSAPLADRTARGGEVSQFVDYVVGAIDDQAVRVRDQPIDRDLAADVAARIERLEVESAFFVSQTTPRLVRSAGLTAAGVMLMGLFLKGK
jgi:hypothetical protein